MTMEITHYGIQRIDDMTREELATALRQSIVRYMEIARLNMSSGKLADPYIAPGNEYWEFWHGKAHPPAQSHDLDEDPERDRIVLPGPRLRGGTRPDVGRSRRRDRRNLDVAKS